MLAGTDLSIGRVLGLCAAVTASLVQSATYVQRMYPQITEPLNLMIPLLLAIAIGVLFGAINGFGVAKLHLHAFIITLGTSLIAWGINSLYIESQPSGTAQALSTFTKGFLNAAAGNLLLGSLRIPKVVLYFLALAVIMHIVWTRTRLGKNMFAVGGNEEAAAVSGVSVTRTIMYVYLIAGALYGIAAYLEAGRIQSVGTNTGINYELDAISACVIGGVSFSGGVGHHPRRGHRRDHPAGDQLLAGIFERQSLLPVHHPRPDHHHRGRHRRPEVPGEEVMDKRNDKQPEDKRDGALQDDKPLLRKDLFALRGGLYEKDQDPDQDTGQNHLRARRFADHRDHPGHRLQPLARCAGGFSLLASGRFSEARFAMCR